MSKRSHNNQHTITAEIPYDIDGDNLANLEIEITFTHTKGSPEVRYQRNGDPGWPAESDEVTVMDAKLLDGDGLNPTPEQLIEIAADWINDAGFEQACAVANGAEGPDPDAAYEAKRDRDMERD